MQRLAVEGDAFQLAVRRHQDRAAGGFIHAAGFHAHQPVLHQVHAADGIASADLVQALDQFRRRELPAVDRNRIPEFETDLHRFRFVGRLFGRDGQLEQIFFRGIGEVFQRAALVGEVPQIPVPAVERFAGRIRQGDVSGFGVGDRILARADVPLAPGGDDLQARIERGVGQLEAHLVVALAGAAVGDGIRAVLLRRQDLVLGDQRPGDGSPQQILPFIDCPGAEQRENVIAREFLAQVLADQPARAGFTRPFGQRRGLADPLPDIGGETHHFAPVGFLQPGDNDRGIQPAGISKHDLLGAVLFHPLLLCPPALNSTQP